MADGIANGNYAQYLAQALTPPVMGVFGPAAAQMSPQGYGVAQGQEFGYPPFGQPGGFTGNSLAANPLLAGSPFLAGGPLTGWAGNQGAQHPIGAAQINVILSHLANQIAAQGAILTHLFNVVAAPSFQNPGLYAVQSRPGLPGNIAAPFGNQGAGSQGLGFGNLGFGWLGQQPYGTPQVPQVPQVGYGPAVSPGFAQVVPSSSWGGNRPTLM